MTTFAPSAARRAAAPTLRHPATAGRLTTWMREWNHAFRAAAANPRREGMDPTVLALFGRD